jgi:hypothetical protein
MIETSQAILNEGTLIPIGVAVAAVGSVILLVWNLSAKASQVIYRLDAIERKLNDHWTRADQLEWIISLRDNNPSLKIPLPRPQHTENP